MRELAVLTFLTCDGVMQAPAHADEDRSNDFDRGGWATNYWSEVMEQVNDIAMAVPYDLLLGRKTYESFAPHWSGIKDDPHADILNSAKKYVVTSTRSALEWNNSIPITGDVVAAISRLKKEDGPLLQVHGSWQLIQTLLEHRLIDEFRLWTFPVVVGHGKRLFGDGGGLTNLSLSKTAATSNGVTMSVYRRIADK